MTKVLVVSGGILSLGVFLVGCSSTTSAPPPVVVTVIETPSYQEPVQEQPVESAPTIAPAMSKAITACGLFETSWEIGTEGREYPDGSNLAQQASLLDNTYYPLAEALSFVNDNRFSSDPKLYAEGYRKVTNICEPLKDLARSQGFTYEGLVNQDDYSRLTQIIEEGMAGESQSDSDELCRNFYDYPENTVRSFVVGFTKEIPPEAVDEYPSETTIWKAYGDVLSEKCKNIYS